jgi:hypothetical protein
MRQQGMGSFIRDITSWLNTGRSHGFRLLAEIVPLAGMVLASSWLIKR